MNKIKVKCLNGFKIIKRGIWYAEVIEGREYIATLCEESGEYLAKDDNGHKFLVGELDFDEKLILEEDFTLITR